MESYFEGLSVSVNILLFILGMIIIAKGSDYFISASVNIAEITGIPKMIIGATIVSILTTFPEFSVSFIATLLNKPYTAVGNAIGSTICNAGLILGTVVILKPMETNLKMVQTSGGFLIFACIVILFLSRYDYIYYWGGLILLGIFITYILSSIFEMKKGMIESPQKFADTVSTKEELNRKHQIRKNVIILLVGGLSVGIGSILLVQSGTQIARFMGVSELIIGLTFTALGTSLPEYITALKSVFKGHSDLGVGNIIGANLLDLVWVIGSCALVRPLPIASQTRNLDIPVMLFIMIIFMVFCITGKRLKRWEGVVLLLIYLIYVSKLYFPGLFM